jgi:L-fucose isomerase-like protein
MPAQFMFTPVLPPFAGADQNELVVSGYIERLESMGGARGDANDYGNRVPLLMLIATGGTEGAALELLARREANVPGEPVLLLAHPGNNSLPAALELLARLQQDGAAGRIVYLRGLDDEAGWESLERALHDASVRVALHAARIGMVGAPSDWLVASSPESSIVTNVWGPEIVPVAMEELTAAMEAVADDAVTTVAATLANGAHDLVELAPADLTEAARVYTALRNVVRERRLDALTVRCFDIVIQRGTSGCFALSELTDEGVIAGCEGDIVSTVGMLWASLLTGEVPWMANPSDLDEEENALWLAHCTVPRTMLEGYSLRSHFESGLGVGIQGTLPKGPVTLLRIGGALMDELWLAEGDLTDVGDKENLCRTQARIALSRGDVRDLLTAPLGNHIVMVRGHHGDRLGEWWETML